MNLNGLKNMSTEKLIALASILNLHDPEDPETPTMTHITASDTGNSDKPFKVLSKDSMIKEIEWELSTAGGHTVANIFRGFKGVKYREIVWDVAEYVNLKPSETATIAEVEGLIAQKVLKKMLEKLTDDQKNELAENLERIAAQHGKSFLAEGGVLTALTAAQLSGFGIFLAASTSVGALTGLLGITLPFAFYTGMSSVIATVIGPVGWAFLGITAVYKIGAPNYKKLLPAVLFIAAERNEQVLKNKKI